MMVGQKVCVKGRGTDGFIHVHGTVDRLTKTMIVVRQPSGAERRFGYDGTSKPYQPYGGTRVHTTCQKPKEK